MTRAHFDIEDILRPRKVAIRVPGYDPEREVQKAQQRVKRIRHRMDRRQAGAQQQPTPSLDAMQQGTDAEVAELNRLLAQPLPDVDSIFAEKKGGEECTNPFL